MIGYCKDGEYLALLYEHMSEGNLEDKLRGVLLVVWSTEISDSSIILTEILTSRGNLLQGKITTPYL
jgi:hypothetical protein